MNETFVLDPQNDRVAVSIAILDDALPELDEQFELVIRSSSNEFSLQQHVVYLTIIDNDGKNSCGWQVVCLLDNLLLHDLFQSNEFSSVAVLYWNSVYMFWYSNPMDGSMGVSACSNNY